MDLPRPGVPRTWGIEFAPAVQTVPSALYIGPDDYIRMSTFSSVPNQTLELRGRILRADGEIALIALQVAPASDRSLVDLIAPIGEGFLLNLRAVVTAGGTVRRGQTWAILSVLRGAVGNFQVAGLAHGYVMDGGNLFWPGGFYESQIDGAGFLRSIAGTDPAAGAEVTETVPTGARWRLRGLRVQLVTSATVATRRVSLVIDDGATILYQIDVNVTQAASLTVNYDFVPDYPSTGVAIVDTITFLPPDLVLRAGWRIRTVTASIQAGDNYGAPQLLVEEWLEL